MKKKRKSKYIQNQDLFKLYKQRNKNKPKSPQKEPKSPKNNPQNAKPSLASARVKFKVPTPKHSETPKTDASEGNLLQQYKHYKDYSQLPTNREVKWDNFLSGLEELPPELRIKFINEIDNLRTLYGDEVVAYYLEKRSLLSEINKYSSIDYKSTIAITYLYQLARGIEQANDYSMNDAHWDIRAEAEWLITKNVKQRNQGRYQELLTDEAIQDYNLTMALDEYVDSLWDETS